MNHPSDVKRLVYRGWTIERRTGKGYAWTAARPDSRMTISADTKTLVIEMIDAHEDDA